VLGNALAYGLPGVRTAALALGDAHWRHRNLQALSSVLSAFDGICSGARVHFTGEASQSAAFRAELRQRRVQLVIDETSVTSAASYPLIVCLRAFSVGILFYRCFTSSTCLPSEAAGAHLGALILVWKDRVVGRPARHAIAAAPEYVQKISSAVEGENRRDPAALALPTT